MFFHGSIGIRKDAVNVIRKSRILKKYPGFKVGHRATDPGVQNLVLLGNSDTIIVPETPRGPVFDVFFDPSKPIRAFGMIIYIKSEDRTQPPVAAIANLVAHRNRFCSFLCLIHCSRIKAPPSLRPTKMMKRTRLRATRRVTALKLTLT
jgi:hypothetical protein